jgi:hypothetical protein
MITFEQGILNPHHERFTGSPIANGLVSWLPYYIRVRWDGNAIFYGGIPLSMD